jgi:hypothetical protein
MAFIKPEIELDPRLNWFIAIGNNGWGRSKSMYRAITTMRRYQSVRSSEYALWACPEGAVVTDGGFGGAAVSWPTDGPEPVRIR